MSISTRHSAIGCSADFNAAKKIRIAMAFLPGNSSTFQRSSGRKYDLLHVELQKRSNSFNNG